MTTTLVVVLIVLIALLIVGIVAALVVRWVRGRDERRPLRNFTAMIRTAHATMGVRDPYSVPRVLATGTPAALDALAKSWRLAPVGEPGWFGRIWHDAEGILIAEPGDSLGVRAAAERRRGATGGRLLRGLLRNRAGRPLDALVWVIALDTLIDYGDAGDKSGGINGDTSGGTSGDISGDVSGEKLRADIDTALEASRTVLALQRQLGQMLPLYIVVTGCDALPGFDALSARLRRERIETPLGWASPYALRRTFEPAWVDEAFADMSRALAATVTEMGTLDGSLDSDVFLLPRRLDALREPLREHVEPTLRGGADGTAPLLRGIWCVGAVPQGGARDEPGMPPAKEPRGAAPAFASRLWHDVVMPGQGLAIAIPRVLALRMRRYRFATYAAIALGIFWCVGLGVTTWHVRSDARVLAGSYDALALASVAWHEAGASDNEAAAARALGSAADAFVRVPRWQLATPLMPLSYFGLRRRLDDAQYHVLSGLVFTPLRARLVSRLADLNCDTGPQASADDVSLAGTARRPQDLPAYTQGTQLVANAAQTELLIANYNELVLRDAGNTVMLAQLMRGAVGVSFSPDHVADRAGLDEAVRETGVEGGQLPFDGTEARAAHARASVCFEETFDRWFDDIYQDSSLTTNAAQIQAMLADLKAPGAVPSTASLSGLATRIDTLATQVDTADHGWAGTHGQELVPGLTATFDTAKGLRLIGATPVASVLDHEQNAQSAFAARWLASGNLPGVLASSPATGLQLAQDLLPLRDALRTLLGQPFVAGEGGGNAEIRSVDADAVQRALAVLPAYKQYAAGPLAQAPEAWRGALLAAAGNATVHSMVAALSVPNRAAATADPGRARDIAYAPQTLAAPFDTLRKNALDLVEAFDSLGRPDLAQAVALRVSDAALDVLRSTDVQLQSLEPFQPMRGDFSGWNGSPGGSMRAFGAATPEALQTYLAAQASAVADTAAGAASAIDWLTTQNPPLSTADARLVARWKALFADLAQYRARSPASALVAVPSIISNQLDKMDLDTCSASLAQVEVPGSGDIVASAGTRLVSSARERCYRLQIGTGGEAYEQLRSYFERYLAGRFPFSADANAQAADLRQTATFVALLDAKLADAQRGMSAAAASGGPHAGAQQFLARLARAKPWLDALVARGADGALVGVDVAVDWRIDRADEAGADQVIQWSLASGSQTLAWPAAAGAPLRWAPGQPAALSLRWAKDGPWRPMQDASQPTLSVDGEAATWAANDTWALLRLVRLHAVPEDGVDGSAGNARMLLSVPVRDRNGATQTARMFMRLGMTGASKTALSWPDLPYSAPGGSLYSPPAVTYGPWPSNPQAGRG
ncbi:type VI secretion system protein [Paraburkholderia mimosarum]|uniref:type VI secretion system protein n=1 Tax=Paraburkholderia mimosarum TaxID=312026 RepID=UPI0004251118|nr:type VI secretion system protein [Paraburkholderia mimosarum]